MVVRGRMLIGAVAVAVASAACSAAPSTPGAPTSTPVAPSSTSVAPSSSAPPASTAAPGPPTSTGGIANCATAELKASLGQGEGAAGSVYAPLILTDVGPRTCELRGFPGVSYVAGADGHQVGPAAAMSGPRGGEVVLKPGAAAAAQLQLANVGNFDAAACRPVPVRGLRIYPPGDTASLYVDRAGLGCSATPPGNQLSIQTLKPA
ncbi:MAG TPA: DUF4232 domain-containing protein [Pseudonocardia sp.]